MELRNLKSQECHIKIEDSLLFLMEILYEEEKAPIVVLVDEYDKLIISTLEKNSSE
jgi:hypothetical protein